MGRDAVSKSGKHVFELLGLFFGKTDKVEDFLLYLGVVDANATTTNFIAIEDEIVLESADFGGVTLQEGEIIWVWRSEHMVRRGEFCTA